MSEVLLTTPGKGRGDPSPVVYAGPVAANSPTVLTPPIPRWGPSVARGGAPRSLRHPPESPFTSAKLFSDWG